MLEQVRVNQCSLSVRGGVRERERERERKKEREREREREREKERERVLDQLLSADKYHLI